MFEELDGATPLDPDEIDGLKYKNITTRGELNELEQANVQQGLLWLYRRQRGDILTATLIRQLHKRLFGDVWSWAGDFRHTEKNIGVDPIQIPMQLRDLFDNTRYWIEHKVHHPLEAAARFHHRLVQIHPFNNGNGRHARIATDLLLKDHYDHSRIDWAKGSMLELSSTRRDAYISALRAADAHDFKPLLTFVGFD